MGLMTDAAVVNIEGNTKQLVDQINKADKAMQNFDTTLTDILSHLTAVEQGLGKVNNVTNNFNKTQKGNFFNGQTNSFAGAKGSAASFTSTRTNAYKQAAEDYHKLQLQEIEVMEKQIEKDQKIIDYKNEQIKNYATEAATRRINANAKYRKTDYLNSAQHLAYEEGLGIKHKNLEGWYAAKSAHPERFLAGALNYSFSHQGARALNGIGDSIRGIGVGGRIAGDILNIAASFLKAPAAGLMATFKNLGQEMIDLGKAATQAYAEIESIKTQLGVVFSNQTQADAMFGQISQYAVKSPFGVQQTSELAVLLKQSGVYASDLMDTLKMLGDTAGGNMEKMKRIANNYAQIVSIGKASMLDMRQFAYAGIPIFEAVSKELGVSQQELRKLISSGKVTSDIIEKVFKDLTGINGLFENATEKGAKTLKARLQNLQDARQLAFSQIGEWGVKLGTQTGGDSYVNKLVDIAEKVYDHLKTSVNTVNIEKSVQSIATRNENIERYRGLIEFAKTINSKSLEAAFTDKLNKELAKQNPDEARSTYVQSYQNKTRGFDLLNNNNVTGTIASIQQEIDELNQKMNSLNVRYWKNQEINSVGLDKIWAATRVADARQGNLAGMAARGSDERLQVDALQERVNLLQEILAALKDYKNVSDELRRAIKEDAAIQAQQLAFDTTNRNADASTSLNVSFNELASLYEGSTEYQKKEEEKKIKILQDAQRELKGIAAKADEKGNVRFNEFDRNEFQRLNKAGAFNATKLDIVEGNKPLTAENRAKLESQFANASGKIIEEFAGSRLADTTMGKEAMKEFQSRFMSLASISSDEDFFRQFGSVITDMSNALKQLENFNPADREWLQSLQQYLIQSTNSYEARVKGVNADPNDITKGKYEFVPLWKRILAGATGLSTQGMTGTLQTLENYKNDMAVRNMASSVMSAAMKSMGVDTAMGLIRTSGGAKVLRGDTGATYQVDWKETRKAIKEFSLSLSASTEVITAYKNSLQQELDTYEQLVAAGYTEAESQDLKNQKTISTKALKKLSQDAGDQLVNAFGEVIRTKSGREYNVADVTFRNGQMFDKVGKPIEEEVVITGKLFDFIKGELPRLYNELHEANAAELNNGLIKKMFNEISATSYLERYISNKGVNKQAILASQNQDYISSYLNSQLTAYKSLKDADDKQLNDEDQAVKKLMNKKFNGFSISSLSNEDFYLTAMTAPDRIKQLETQKSYYNSKETKTDEDKKTIQRLDDNIEGLKAVIELIDKSFSNMAINLSNIMESSESSTLLGKIFTKQRDEAVLNDYITSRQFSKYGLADQTSLRPRDYTGERGTRNRLFEFFTGTELKYDREDYLAQAVKDPSFRKKINEQRNAEWLSGRYKEGPLELLPEDNESILKMTNEELAKMLSYSEQIGVTWEKSSEELSKGFEDISKNTSSLLRDFASSAITSTFETWGKYLGDSSKASEEIGKNLQSMSANLFKSMGQMVTQAGLSLAISSIGDKGKVMTGLAIAAAGGGFSMLGGMMDQDNDDDKDADTYQKLLKVKQDLSDLLKQAREDAIYYENTVRHKKAVSANDYLTKSVHDAVISPRGDIITTDPKDYLIATKTPKTLVGGGAPTINFSVIDKSTGIMVTQQRSTYDEASNTIEFEAIIESKVQEVIASSKGDDAFAAREARLRGHSVIA